MEGRPRDVQKACKIIVLLIETPLTFSLPSPSSLVKLPSETEGEGRGMKGRGLLATVQATFI